MTTEEDRDYYLELAITAVKEYVKDRLGMEWYGEDRVRYKSIILEDKEFHVFAFFRYGLYFNNYQKDTKEFEIHRLAEFETGRYKRELLAFLLYCFDRFGSAEEFKKVYEEFRKENPDLQNIQELNNAFKQEFHIPNEVLIPSDLKEIIDKIRN